MRTFVRTCVSTCVRRCVPTCMRTWVQARVPTCRNSCGHVFGRVFRHVRRHACRHACRHVHRHVQRHVCCPGVPPHGIDLAGSGTRLDGKPIKPPKPGSAAAKPAPGAPFFLKKAWGLPWRVLTALGVFARAACAIVPNRALQRQRRHRRRPPSSQGFYLYFLFLRLATGTVPWGRPHVRKKMTETLDRKRLKC